MSTPRATAAVRDTILDTASRLFASQGYRATGINQIIRESGAAKASFYHHFPSKEALGEAFVERRHTQWFDAVERRLAVEDTPGARLLALFALWDEQIAAEGFRGCLFVNMAAEFPAAAAPVRQRIKAHKEAVRELIGRLVAEHKAQNNAVGDARLDADSIYLLYDGALVETLNFQSSWPVRSARRMVALLLGTTEAA